MTPAIILSKLCIWKWKWKKIISQTGTCHCLFDFGRTNFLVQCWAVPSYVKYFWCNPFSNYSGPQPFPFLLDISLLDCSSCMVCECVQHLGRLSKTESVLLLIMMITFANHYFSRLCMVACCTIALFIFFKNNIAKAPKKNLSKNLDNNSNMSI